LTTFRLLDDIIDIRIIPSERRQKSLSIQVKAGEIVVRAPLTVTEAQILQVLEQRRSWLESVWQTSQRMTEGSKAWRDRIYLYGHRLTLCFEQAPTSQYTVELNNRTLQVRGPELANDDAVLRRIVETWLKDTAKAFISERVKHWSRRMNCTYNDIRFKDLKSRWGSCSQRGNLNFNWRLIGAPIEVIDYVVVHELSHRFEMNHSQRFWKKVEEFVPNYPSAKQWLKTNGGLLLSSHE
jgi:predicted metal-dependent hydrolase